VPHSTFGCSPELDMTSRNYRSETWSDPTLATRASSVGPRCLPRCTGTQRPWGTLSELTASTALLAYSVGVQTTKSLTT
jgi:hypothetical protein